MDNLPNSDEYKQHILELLMNRTVIDNSISQCYYYRGYITPQGYGSLKLPEGKFLIHRLSAWIHLDFDLSSKLQVNHVMLCVSNSCWNPKHLYIGTQKDNMQDRLLVGHHNNGRKEVCKRGHPLKGDNVSINGKGARVCTECARIYRQEHKQQQKEYDQKRYQQQKAK